MNTLPGDPIVLRNGVITIEPFTVMSELASGKLKEEEWVELCKKAGIDTINIGSVYAENLQQNEQLVSII